jgi:hypothetical protein
MVTGPPTNGCRASRRMGDFSPGNWHARAIGVTLGAMRVCTFDVLTQTPAIPLCDAGEDQALISKNAEGCRIADLRP